MTTLIQDLRYGVRALAKNPGFTVVAILTLALGIGANAAIFSVVYGVLLHSLPYPNPDRIVELREVNAKGGQMSFADPNFEDVRSQSHSFQGVAEYSWWLEPVSGGSEPTRTLIAHVSRDFFSIMGVQPALGRGFTTEDQRFGAAPVALMSYGYWRQNLGGTRDLSAITLKIENQSCSVVGVLPPGFDFPGGSDIWVPRELYERLPSRTAHNWHVLARLRDGVPLAGARAELSGIARRIKKQYGQDTWVWLVDIAASPLQEALTRNVRPALLMLLGSVGFLLLVACANVVNLLLARAAARRRELGIRSALGAGRGRLVRQFLTEALLLSLAGGGLGVFAGRWGVDALLAIAPPDLPRLQDVSVNLPVLLFALGISLAVAAGLGVFTALSAASGDPRAALAERGQAGTGAVGSHRLGRSVVAAQLAITLVLLVGASLLGRSLLRLLSIDPGFRAERVVTMDLALPPAEKDADKVRRVNFLNELFARLRAVPGVREAGGTNGLPLTGSLADGLYLLMNAAEKLPSVQELERLFPNASGDADYCVASEGYFKALGIPLLRGRMFAESDTIDTPHVALVSETLAREKWPNGDPLGRAIEFGNMDGDLRLLTVVGVVGDVRQASLEAPPRPVIYVNYRQRPSSTSRFTVVLRTDTEPAAVSSAAREILRSLDPNVPPKFNTFTGLFSASLQTRRFNLTLLGAFAATALLLAMAGIYGVMAYTVARRTHEIGVRIALGARPGDVLRLVLAQGALTAAVGVAVGICGSFVLARTLRSLLFGVSAADPPTLVSVVILLVAVALLASYIPARRATKVDPMVALRDE